MTDLTGNLVSCQVSPVFEYGTTISESRFELAFIANVPALSLVTYTVQALEKKEAPRYVIYFEYKSADQILKCETTY